MINTVAEVKQAKRRHGSDDAEHRLIDAVDDALAHAVKAEGGDVDIFGDEEAVDLAGEIGDEVVADHLG